MLKVLTAPTIPSAVLLAVLHTAPARALTVHTWVSVSLGVDSSNTLCTRSAPCLTFQHAHDQTARGGEISVLDPGDYGQLITNKSITITNDGPGQAGIHSSLPVSLQIEGGAGDVIGLRGLTLDGETGGDVAIEFNAGSALHIQNCVIRNYQSPGRAIFFEATGHSQLFVSDTLVYNNGSVTFSGGIFVSVAGTGSAAVVLDHVRLENNVIALRADGGFGTGNGVHLIIGDSVISGNAGDGILAITIAGRSPAFLLVERTRIVNNAGTALRADGPGATILFNGNTISRNGTGISAANSGQLISYGNNLNNNNVGAEGTATGTFNPM